ncbi:regulatory protein [Morganella morganii]|uniref:Regulatory protein n=1 Tax=Morganella morganii TaxID=582 RepID=A0A0D8L9B6_MORMO|nr:regulatory protein [Morganella morganii]
MAWWFAAPLVIWGAKKIYDAVTEGDEPSYSSSSSSTLTSAKSTRTKVRKKLIREAILKNRKSLISKTFSDKESETVKLDGSSKADATFDLSGLNVALDNLSNTIRLLNPTYSDCCRKIDDSLFVFTDLNVEVNNVAKKANYEYGSMAGIDHYNEYDRAIDPFVAKLQSEFLR